MDEWIDISLPVSPQLPVWPGSPQMEATRRLDLDRGDPVNDTTIRLSVHTGSHVDAPLHFLAGGDSVDRMPLEVLIGPACVASTGGADSVTAALLNRLFLPIGVQRLLLRTANSDRWPAAREFDPGYVALTADAAQWMVDRKIRLVGVDSLSVQRYRDGPEAHLILLGAGVVIVEGLNLAGVEPGMYELCCLPLRLSGAEGAPARAVLRRAPPR
ncbi:MAG TPA: cyclase family protein [bacterium]|nr:cyclase family protein [bacterium]